MPLTGQRVLVRSGKAPHHVVSPEGSLARNGWGVFGANVGNLLFTNSVFRAVNVDNAKVVSDSLITELSGRHSAEYISRINEEFDAFVVPLANAFRPQFQTSLGRLTAAIERLRIPVVVVGVGVQALAEAGGRATAGDEMDATARAFVRAVLDRSASIGVRGETTADYLSGLGFGGDLVDIIGCPSLHDEPSPVPIQKRVAEIDLNAPIAMSVTPSAPGMGAIVAANAEKYRDLVYIPQEHHELAMLMWDERIKTDDDRLPLHREHVLYRSGRIRFFVDPTTWKDFLAGREFSFGTRIHGTIAALAAGTPGVLLSHDARTLELARYHRIPHHLANGDEDFDAAVLYAAADFGEFNAFRREGFERYTAFLERNGLHHIFEDGYANPAYDELLRTTPYPPGVPPLLAETTNTEAELAARVRWLRQGAREDKGRWTGGYIPPFRPTPPEPAAAKMSDLEKKLDAAIARIGDLEQQLAEQRRPALFRKRG